MNGSGSGLWALLVGVLSGAIFFGGLWWTVRNGTSARNPAAWFLSSLLLRAAVVTAGFYFVVADGWQSSLLCTAAFLATRTAMFHVIQVARLNPHAS